MNLFTILYRHQIYRIHILQLQQKNHYIVWAEFITRSWISPQLSWKTNIIFSECFNYKVFQNRGNRFRPNVTAPDLIHRWSMWNDKACIYYLYYRVYDILNRKTWNHQLNESHSFNHYKGYICVAISRIKVYKYQSYAVVKWMHDSAFNFCYGHR